MFPDQVIIGESGPKAGTMVENIYKVICPNKTPINRMSLASAEITKLSLNAYVTMKISFINSLGDICAKFPHANIKDISKALGNDRRISPHYLKPGLSYGGPCFPRDNKAFQAFAQSSHVHPYLAIATDKINKTHHQYIIQQISFHIGPARLPVSVIGLAYKPQTHVIEESPAIPIIKYLLKRKIKVIAYDPLAMNNIKSLFGKKITYASSLKECLAMSHQYLVINDDPAFQAIERTNFLKPVKIIDCWGKLHIPDKNKMVKYISLNYPLKNRMPDKP